MTKGRPRKFAYREVALALKGAYGVLSTAADILGCDVGTVRNYLKRSPEVRAARREGRRRRVDLCETELMSIAMGKKRRGTVRDQLAAIRLILERMGRDRGWNPMVDVRADGPLRVVVERVSRPPRDGDGDDRGSEADVLSAIRDQGDYDA